MVMTRDKLLQSIDRTRIENAIRNAELQTSGEICVSVSRFFWGDVNTVAKKAFARLRISKTRLRNGVLIFVVPARRKFVFIGDSGIHEKVGTEFWNQIVAKISICFGAGDFSGGIIVAIEDIGKQLSAHFPVDATSRVNELPDKVN